MLIYNEFVKIEDINVRPFIEDEEGGTQGYIFITSLIKEIGTPSFHESPIKEMHIPSLHGVPLTRILELHGQTGLDTIMCVCKRLLQQKNKFRLQVSSGKRIEITVLNSSNIIPSAMDILQNTNYRGCRPEVCPDRDNDGNLRIQFRVIASHSNRISSYQIPGADVSKEEAEVTLRASELMHLEGTFILDGTVERWRPLPTKTSGIPLKQEFIKV